MKQCCSTFLNLQQGLHTTSVWLSFMLRKYVDLQCAGHPFSTKSLFFSQDSYPSLNACTSFIRCSAWLVLVSVALIDLKNVLYDYLSTYFPLNADDFINWLTDPLVIQKGVYTVATWVNCWRIPSKMSKTTNMSEG